MEPWLSRYEKPISREQEIFESSFNTSQQQKFIDDRTVHIPKPDKKQQGGVVKDDRGYWNPDNHGKAVEIGSNNITMKGVDQPLVGVSDVGDTKIMYPGKDYKFKGKKVTEYPLTQEGWLSKY